MRPCTVAKGIETPQMAKILELLVNAELAATQVAVVEVDRHLKNVAAMALHDDFQKDFIAYRIELAPGIQGRSAHREEAAHRVADGSERKCKYRRYAAIQPPQRTPVFRCRSAVGEARADRHIGTISERA